MSLNGKLREERKTVKVQFFITESMKKKMDKFKWVNWSEKLRLMLKDELRRLEQLEQL